MYIVKKYGKNMKTKAFVDTHCHINMMIKKNFDETLKSYEIESATLINEQAKAEHVTTIINVGTSLVESNNCIALAQAYSNMYAVVGIHPNDCTDTWRTDFNTLHTLVKNAASHKIVGIGECGIDKHYPDYNLSRQQDAFRAQIELALEYNLALVVHSRDAYDETLMILDEYKQDIQRGVMHCFSYDRAFADHVLHYNFVLGIGGTITYPKNNALREMVQTLDLSHIVLETDAPFLPPQAFRGKQNHPEYIALIAEYIAQLRNESIEHVAQLTTHNAYTLFNLDLI